MQKKKKNYRSLTKLLNVISLEYKQQFIQMSTGKGASLFEVAAQLFIFVCHIFLKKMQQLVIFKAGRFWTISLFGAQLVLST